jgi:LPS export ABC transporter protein LptC
MIARTARSPAVSTGVSASLAALILVTLLSFTLGCSLDYGAVTAEDKIAETIPDTVAIEMTHKVHQDGRLALAFEAGRAETYGALKKMILSDVRFVEYGADRAPSTSGKARHVVYHTDTENAEISGSVRVRSEAEKASIATDSLAWENKQKKLTALPLARVVITKDDGSSITGRGFAGDFRTREVTFSGPVEGTYVWTEEEN